MDERKPMKIIKIFPFFILVILLFLISCQKNNLPISQSSDYINFLWVGDDSLSTGPLDMQVLLFLELNGYTTPVKMERILAPRNVLSFVPPSLEFLDEYSDKQNTIVILQMFGLEKSFSEAEFISTATQWVKNIKGKNAKVVLLYPWFSQVESNETSNRLDILVHQFAWQNELTLIPVAPAWELVKREHPEIQLYASDGLHPSAEGVYLTACVVYSSITGKSPLGLSAKTSIGYDLPEKIISINDPVIKILQESAWIVMEEYEQKGEFEVFLLK